MIDGSVLTLEMISFDKTGLITFPGVSGWGNYFNSMKTLGK